MYELAVPTLNSNDTTYVLTEWLFEDGDAVPAGAEVAVVETSKAAEGLVCAEGGILRREVRTGRECRPGEVLARLFGDEEERRRFTAALPEQTAQPDLVVTEPARRLIERHGLDPDLFRRTGRTVVGRADVERVLGERAGTATVAAADRGQRAVARMVTLAHRTIPTAHATVAVTVDAALEYLAREGGRIRLPELLIRTVAASFERFPRFFAEGRDDGGYVPATEPGIGVTVDVGRGLAMPVVRGPALASLRTIADTLAAFRETALRGRFTEAELAGGNIGISLPAGDVIQVRPLVLPGHSCMLALGATQVVAQVDADGRVVARHVVHLSAAYDHRLVNGRDAAMFLGHLKRGLESAQ
jgi:2-oxoglutarate dehydrogenase E2 component (dihydrolipoamide succinyltransferase)